MPEQDPRQRFLRSHWDAASTEVSGAFAQKRRLASAMRLVIERLVASNAPED